MYANYDEIFKKTKATGCPKIQRTDKVAMPSTLSLLKHKTFITSRCALVLKKRPFLLWQASFHSQLKMYKPGYTVRETWTNKDEADQMFLLI